MSGNSDFSSKSIFETLFTVKIPVSLFIEKKSCSFPPIIEYSTDSSNVFESTTVPTLVPAPEFSSTVKYYCFKFGFNQVIDSSLHEELNNAINPKSDAIIPEFLIVFII
jgi:hypothetical protein